MRKMVLVMTEMLYRLCFIRVMDPLVCEVHRSRSNIRYNMLHWRFVLNEILIQGRLFKRVFIFYVIVVLEF